jgi:serine protease inhibitor
VVGHSFGGSQSVLNVQRIHEIIEEEGATPNIHLITIDAINFHTAWTDSAKVNLASHTNYFQLHSGAVKGDRIDGARNFDSTDDVRRFMDQNDTPFDGHQLLGVILSEQIGQDIADIVEQRPK